MFKGDEGTERSQESTEEATAVIKAGDERKATAAARGSKGAGGKTGWKYRYSSKIEPKSFLFTCDVKCVREKRLKDNSRLLWLSY